MTAAIKPVKVTKITTLLEMLEREDGASLSEICAATGWQAHSARAALSGLRKAGHTIERHVAIGDNEEARYALVSVPTPTASEVSQ